ncbi:MAG: radical SAM family heme chaperone HemW [Thermoanaerobaculia bacterium]|jgi:oxygen-independent coproporphyrinogen-3 oxidase
MTSTDDSMGIYVHLPFCRRRCSYCPFAISVDRRLASRYHECLSREIAEIAPEASRVETVYFGGGTPSLSSEGELAMVRRALERFDLRGVREWTIEANPEDFEPGSIDAWKALGVTRLSVGVQSLHDGELRPLGRLHGRDGALSAAGAAVASGLRASVDVIIGLPGQSPDSFAATLRPLLDLGVGHVSLYILDLDEDSPLRKRVHSGRVALPDEEAVAGQYELAIELCSSFGLEQYEVSNFARPGEESLHNLRYWRRERYLGFGLGAHSFANGRRWANSRDIAEYMDLIDAGRSSVTFEEILTSEEEGEERIFLGLRRTSGLEASELETLAPERAAEWIGAGLANGWIRLRDGRVAFTPRGFLVSSELIAELF